MSIRSVRSARSFRSVWPLVAVCVVTFSTAACALKVYELESPDPAQDATRSEGSSDDVPIPAALGRFEVVDFEVGPIGGSPSADRRIIYRWQYTNDTSETITQVVGWICRVHDVNDFVIATQDIKIYPRKYGPLEPGVKLRGVREVRVYLDGEIDRVACVGQS